jgi:hypothetical protein
MPLSSGSIDQPNVPQEGAKPLFDMSNARPIGQPKPLFDMSSSRPIGKPQPLFDMSNARPIGKPAAAPTVKSAPVAPAPAPQSAFSRGEAHVDSALDAAGRYGQRLGQSLGIPTNKSELTAAGTPPSLPAAIAGPGPSGIYNQLVQSGKTLYQGAKDTYKEAKEAGQNIAAGGPVLQNIAKPASTALNATVGAVPFIGAPTVRAGEDVAAKNYAGAAGGLTGVLGQVALEGAGERRLGTDEMAFHDAKVKEATAALKEAKKAATTNYQASIDKNIKLPKEVQKPIDTAQAALDEAVKHQAAAKQAIAERQVKPPAPEPTTAQVTAQPQAPRPAPAMRVPGTPENVKTPGQVQPETFPQQPTAKPMVIPGVKTLADNQGTVGMRRMLTEGTPEAAPSANAETAPKTETPPATMQKLGKPERGNLKTLKVGEGGKVVDTETPLDRQLKEALKPGEAKAPVAAEAKPQTERGTDRRQATVPVEQERRVGERRNPAGLRVDAEGNPVMSPDVQGHWQSAAFGEKPVKDIGAKAREANPEPTRAETKGEVAKPALEKAAPATEPGLMQAGEEGREPAKSAAEYHPAVQEQVFHLSNDNLDKLAQAHGIDPKAPEYSRAKEMRNEGRHQTGRQKLAEDITAQMGDDEKINIGRNAEKLEHNADMANKTKAERAASLFPRLRGAPDFNKFHTTTMEKPGPKSPLKKM